MELLKVPNNTWVRAKEEVRVPPAAPAIKEGDLIRFGHIDGMYSYCTTPEGQIVHMAAWTEVEVVTNPLAAKMEAEYESANSQRRWTDETPKGGGQTEKKE